MMKLFFAITLLVILAAFGGFQLGSRISEVKTSLIYSLDDISSLIAIKKEMRTEESMHLYENLKKRYIWRVEGLWTAYESSKFKWLMEFDGDIDRGYKSFESRKKDL